MTKLTAYQRWKATYAMAAALNLSPSELLVLQTIAIRDGRRGAFPGRDRIAEESRLTVRTVTTAIAGLVEKGALIRQRRRRKTTVYTVNYPRPAELRSADISPQESGHRSTSSGVSADDPLPLEGKKTHSRGEEFSPERSSERIGNHHHSLYGTLETSPPAAASPNASKSVVVDWVPFVSDWIPNPLPRKSSTLTEFKDYAKASLEAHTPHALQSAWRTWLKNHPEPLRTAKRRNLVPVREIPPPVDSIGKHNCTHQRIDHPDGGYTRACVKGTLATDAYPDGCGALAEYRPEPNSRTACQ